MAGVFNAQRARAKRPCPLWVDAFQRDTQHLEADEIGAYFLILMAMWTRETCDFPNEPSRLARVSRVSVRLWKSRIGPALMPFFDEVGGALVQKRLREEAAYTERQVQHQSDRKRGEKSDNSLKNNKPNTSADISTGKPWNHPTQLPNIREKEEPKGSSKKKGSRLTEDWVLPRGWGQWAVESEGLTEEEVRRQAERFRDFWLGVSGQRGVKMDWQATWRNWIRRYAEDCAAKKSPPGRAGGGDGFEQGVMRRYGIT